MIAMPGTGYGVIVLVVIVVLAVLIVHYAEHDLLAGDRVDDEQREIDERAEHGRRARLDRSHVR